MFRGCAETSEYAWNTLKYAKMSYYPFNNMADDWPTCKTGKIAAEVLNSVVLTLPGSSASFRVRNRVQLPGDALRTDQHTCVAWIQSVRAVLSPPCWHRHVTCDLKEPTSFLPPFLIPTALACQFRCLLGQHDVRCFLPAESRGKQENGECFKFIKVK